MSVGPRKQARVAPLHLQRGGYDARQHRNAQVIAKGHDIAPPLAVVNGKTTLKHVAPLKTDAQDGSFGIDLEALAILLAGRGLTAEGRRVRLIQMDRLHPQTLLAQTITSPPTKAEVEAVQNRVNDLVNAYNNLLLAAKRAQHMKET